MEVRNVRLRDMDFDRKLLHVVQSKGNKDRYIPLSEHLIRASKIHSRRTSARLSLCGQPQQRKGGDFDSRYSQRGVQWQCQQWLSRHHQRSAYPHAATYLCHASARRWCKHHHRAKMMGHVNIESTMLLYLHVCQTPDQLPNSPLDKVFALCSQSTK